MKDCRQFWNMRAQNYDEVIGPAYAAAYDKTVSNTLKYLKPEDRVLEFACGTGIVTLPVAQKVSHVRAIDISDEMVLRLQKKVAEQQIPNLEVSRTDLFDPCLEPGSFDAVLAFNVLCYVENFEEVMARISQLLKPGGLFLSATDCLAQTYSKVAVQKFWRSRRGKMPYVAFFTNRKLEQKIKAAGFTVLERENLFPAPANLFVAARKER